MTYVLDSKEDGDVVKLKDAKAWLKIEDSAEDFIIQSLIDTAVEMAEKHMNRDILTATYINFKESFLGDLTLRRGGFQSVVKIEYLRDGSFTILDPTEFTVSIGGVFGVICEIDIPSDIDTDCNAVKITFKAGFNDDPGCITDDIKTAIKLIVSRIYQNRGDCDEISKDGVNSAMPSVAKNILNSYKIVDLGELTGI